MNYTKPAINILAKAINSVKGTLKGILTFLESPTGVRNDTPSAYEADE